INGCCSGPILADWAGVGLCARLRPQSVEIELIGWLRRFNTQLPLGLAARFTLFVAALLLGLTAAFVFINNRAAERAAETAFEESADNILALVASLASDLPADRRLSDLQSVLDRIAAANPNTRYAYAIGVDRLGAQVANDPDSVRNDPIASIALMDAVSSGLSSYRRGDGILHIAAPIKVD